MDLRAPLFFGQSLPCDASLEEILDACRELLCDATFPTLRLWQEQGGRVLGHFQVYMPEEIADAAGMLAVKLGCTTGNGGAGGAHFGSYLCSVVKQVFNLVEGGDLSLDLLIVPSICDAARNLPAIWSRNFSTPCRTLYLPQNSTAPAAENYLRQEYAGLAAVVSEVTGRPLELEAVRRSIAVYNRHRRLLRELQALKSREPRKLALDEYYLLTAVGSLLPPGEHNRLLERVLPLLAMRQRQQQDKIRVVLCGCFCEQPPLGMLEAIARCCHVVSDDLLIGLRWLTGDVDVQGDPLAALAHAYCTGLSRSPVQHDPHRQTADLLLKQVKQQGAQAVIITAPKMCEPGLDELVPAVAALTGAGIPSCICEFEQGMNSFELVELQVETFSENILYAGELP
ncbi:2-hydroxyacyl-CoA dehydratase [Trichlorobacter lovleyi]|uniref:2-hydroxyglutaryl-CoA dehydratase D-component n=1 Tax=Trichlorobacter lovleyi (strain ATCC BAA-1151 / DSM 17278 / SZ) TaxID=398767 RepID=B3E5D0_TRIL1|nr:2-hydroxyacyl-CoA dehydratase [Trichlorobacter lovleyi]ACD96117.1 2-hydroxyglutaryl-CoA dehydratase D-component [Trichlorobacter lovleyi SZ]